MDELCILSNDGVKFSENHTTFDPITHIKFPLEIQVCAFKWLKMIGIVMKFSMNVYLVNPNHIKKFFYGRSIIALYSIKG